MKKFIIAITKEAEFEIKAKNKDDAWAIAEGKWNLITPQIQIQEIEMIKMKKEELYPKVWGDEYINRTILQRMQGDIKISWKDMRSYKWDGILPEGFIKKYINIIK